MKRTKFEAKLDKKRAVEKAEKEGKVCDSMEVRREIFKRIESGEITLQEGQKELERIKREGKRKGIPTRSQVWNRS